MTWATSSDTWPRHPRARTPSASRTARPISVGDSFMRLAHPLGGDRRGADPDAGGDHRRLRVVGDGVLVQRDPRGVAARLGLGRRSRPSRLQVEQRQVRVGAAGHRRACPRRPGPRPAPARWRSTCAAYAWYSGWPASFRATALAATACISGPPCIIGKTALSMAAACSAAAQDHAAARAAQHLVRGEASRRRRTAPGCGIARRPPGR